jgi:hypothetical protein
MSIMLPENPPWGGLPRPSGRKDGLGRPLHTYGISPMASARRASKSLGRLWPSVAVLWLTVAVAHAAGDDEQPTGERPLTAWIGADVGFCLEIEGLPQKWGDFCEGPLGKRLLGFPWVAAWREQQQAQLAAIRGEIERRTGVAAKELRTRLLGGQVVFAVWPPGQPAVDKPSALLLAEAADRDLLHRTLERLVAARKQAGKWRGKQTLELGGESHSVDQVASDDEQSEFFVTSVENVAVIATSEPLLRMVLDRSTDSASETSSLARSPTYLASRQGRAEHAAARLFINPRAWDAALEADLKQKSPGSEEARSQAAVVGAWRATDYVAAALQLTPRLHADLAWKWRTDDLPPAVREVASSLQGPTALIEKLPANALVALAGRVDLGRLARLVVAEQWSKSASSRSERNVQGHFNEHPETLLAWALAPGLGPEWGAYLIAADDRAGTEGALPVDAVLAVQTRALEPDTDRPALVHNVEPLLHAWLSAAVAAANHQSGGPVASIKSTERHSRKPDGADASSFNRRANGPRAPSTQDAAGNITVVTGIVPRRPEQELAYCVDGRERLWAATSAEALIEATAPTNSRLLDPSTLEAELGMTGTSGLAYVNLAAWRKLAAKGRQAVDFFWQDEGLDDRAKERKYRELVAVAQVADRLLLASHIDHSTVRLSLTVAADEP